jgi:hypothetical protein
MPSQEKSVEQFLAEVAEEKQHIDAMFEKLVKAERIAAEIIADAKEALKLCGSDQS